MSARGNGTPRLGAEHGGGVGEWRDENTEWRILKGERFGTILDAGKLLWEERRKVSEAIEAPLRSAMRDEFEVGASRVRSGWFVAPRETRERAIGALRRERAYASEAPRSALA